VVAEALQRLRRHKGRDRLDTQRREQVERYRLERERQRGEEKTQIVDSGERNKRVVAQGRGIVGVEGQSTTDKRWMPPVKR